MLRFLLLSLPNEVCGDLLFYPRFLLLRSFPILREDLTVFRLIIRFFPYRGKTYCIRYDYYSFLLPIFETLWFIKYKTDHLEFLTMILVTIDAFEFHPVTLLYAQGQGYPPACKKPCYQLNSEMVHFS